MMMGQLSYLRSVFFQLPIDVQRSDKGKDMLQHVLRLSSKEVQAVEVELQSSSTS